MARGAVLSEIQIEVVGGLVHAQLLDALLQQLVAVLTLASADDLADTGDQAIHSSDGLSVLVQLHVESLDLLRVVGDEDGLLEDLLGEAALVLGLQIAAPEHLVIETIVVLLQDLDGLGVGDAAKIGIHHVVQTIQQSLVHKAVEEVHLLRAVLQHIADHIFQHGLGQLHIVLKIREGDLRLDHPELRRMACGVGILGAEGGAEGVNRTECLAEGLHVQLTADSKVRLLAEEVLTVVHLAVRSLRDIVQVKGGDVEHLARAFSVAGGDQRSVDIHKTALLEEAVDRVGQNGAHPERRLEQVGAGAKMGDGPEELRRVALFLQRIIRSGSALDGDFLSLDLKRLLRLGRRHQLTADDEGSSDVDLADLCKVRHGIVIDHLQLLKERAVADHQETESLGVPVGTDPSADSDLLVKERLSVLPYFSDCC